MRRHESRRGARVTDKADREGVESRHSFKGSEPFDGREVVLWQLAEQRTLAMPRKSRFYLPGLPVHAVQRGHSREAVFYEDSDYRA